MTAGRQALLALARLRCGDTYAQLGAGFGSGHTARVQRRPCAGDPQEPRRGLPLPGATTKGQARVTASPRKRPVGNQRRERHQGVRWLGRRPRPARNT
ncbi:transposase family protein [Streptomyces californicus]|uniref:transposase family protein n=1 Tax=Streptomyces californicus TaxID=67351 RepID=UPI003789A2AD